ncbi:amino acid transporter, partial [Basidiobolus meristosporus CBS 931.73]
EEQDLPRTMGVFTGASMVIGLMVGSGILSTPALVIAMVGSPGASLLLWLLGAIVTLGGAMAYVEMGVMWPQNGGTQHYLAHAYPKPKALLSYAFIWCILFAARPASIAANAPVFGKFVLFAIFGSPTDKRTESYEWLSRFIGLIAITFLLALNSISVKAAQRFHASLTLIKIAVLLIICVSGLLGLMGIIQVPEEAKKSWAHPFANTSLTVGSTASAMHKVFWGYSGWTNLSYSLGELRDPSKNLPRATTLGVGLVSVLYILANIAFFAVVPMSLVLESKEILAAEFTYILFGDVAGRVILPSLIAISMFGSLSAQIYVGARTALSAAKSQYLPYSQLFSGLHPTYGTPIAALLLNYLVVLVYLFSPPPGDTFDFLIGFVQYPTWFFYGMSVFGCLLLRRSQPHHPKRSFKASKVLAIPFIATCIFLTIFPFFPPAVSKPHTAYPYWLSPTMGLLVIIISTLMWYLRMIWWPK